jgi:hypothetical protein
VLFGWLVIKKTILISTGKEMETALMIMGIVPVHFSKKGNWHRVMIGV